MILELLQDGTVRVADRRDAILPVHAPVSTIRRIRRIAARQYAELLKLWEATHGKAF